MISCSMTSNIDGITQFLGEFADSLQRKGNAAAQGIGIMVADKMSEEGEPITPYPVFWDSDKQRRAFFATNGFGKGIPYVRTGAYERGWTVFLNDNGATLFNAHPAGAIGGTLQGWQSQIHIGRWNNILEVILEEMEEFDFVRYLSEMTPMEK